MRGLGALSLLLAAGGAGASSATREIANLATFDEAWRLVAETHFDPDFGGVDWDAVGRELRPRARKAGNATELRAILRQMVERLGQSHFTLIAGPQDSSTHPARSDPERIEGLPARCGQDAYRDLVGSLERLTTHDADPGIELRLMEGELVVSRVAGQSSAAAAAVAPGWSLLRIGNTRLRSYVPCLESFSDPFLRSSMTRDWLAGLLQGEQGSEIRLLFETGRGRTRRLDLARRSPEGEITRFGNLPAVRLRFEHRWLQGARDARIAHVSFNIWLLPVASAFDGLMGELRSAHGVVIDLRGNPGGLAAIAQGVAGHFLDRPVSLGALKSRSDDLQLVVNPRRVTRDGRRVDPYRGPLAILLDDLSASTSEVFAAGLRDLGRARLFGQPSAGAALPAVMDKLPNGDTLLHATLDYIRPNGTRVEGRPVAPDELVVTQRRDLLAGRDPPLEAAVDWILDGAREYAAPQGPKGVESSVGGSSPQRP